MPTTNPTLAQLAKAVITHCFEPKPDKPSLIEPGISPGGMWAWSGTGAWQLRYAPDHEIFIKAVIDYLYERNWIVSTSSIPPIQKNPPHPHISDQRGKVIVRIYRPDANLLEVPSVEIEVWMSREDAEATALLTTFVEAFELEITE